MTQATISETNLNPETREQMAQDLARLLADTFTLYVKTLNCHWNVTGSSFISLHHLFETQYKDLAEAADDIAERIRALGARAPGSCREFSRLSSLTELETALNAPGMLHELADGHDHCSRTAYGVYGEADGLGDQATADLVSNRIRDHEKAAWMLRSSLGGSGARGRSPRNKRTTRFRA